jgi:glucose-6-phosphate 1-dehydrogenase
MMMGGGFSDLTGRKQEELRNQHTASPVHSLKPGSGNVEILNVRFRGSKEDFGVDDDVDEERESDTPRHSRLVSKADCTYIDEVLSIVVVGASGDLAKKKTFPALFDLYLHDFLPSNVIMCGYARSPMTSELLREKLRPFLFKLTDDRGAIDEFLRRVHYKSGQYDSPDDFHGMVNALSDWEAKAVQEQREGHCTLCSGTANRIYYFAIPPAVFLQTAASIRKVGMSTTGWTRLIVEKPFGHDYDSAKKLADDMAVFFDESYLYRIDHYLAKEMVQNLLILRFTNALFEPMWNRDHIKSVTFTFKEDFGTEGRGGYFDTNGIIRDVIQNHLMQVFSLLAMEPPVKATGAGYAEYVRNNKVALLQSVAPIDMDEVVLGQYAANAKGDLGYLDDDTVPNGSFTPTFATIVLRVSNWRWQGVPFIFKAGKALNERKAEIRIQFRDAPGASFMFDGADCPRNELVMRLQPEEALYLKTNVKAPGLRNKPTQAEMDLTYSHRYPGLYNPDAYTRLLLEVLREKQATFVRADEVLASWAIFTPLLAAIDNGELGRKISIIHASCLACFSRDFRNSLSHLSAMMIFRAP